MTYAEFCDEINVMIREGKLKPIWWRVVRTRKYRDLLRSTGLIKET